MTPDAADHIGRATEPAVDQNAEEAAQSELDLGVVSTGSADVDRALRPLDGLAERPVADHAEIFDQVLGELAETMTGPEGAPDAVPIEPAATD
ncbi:MAG: hypothetical protein LH645_01430 [Actinomycetia bacterium]|nr:hypothetical protein [Actinomycetes bacterium]